MSTTPERRSPPPRPTLFGRLVVFFPATQVLGVAALAIAFALEPALWHLAGIAFVVYGYPLLSFRLVNAVAPLREGRALIPNGRYVPWWGSFHLQQIFLAVPWLEAALRLVPGLFSLWLRLWGSRIGRGVYWPPQLEIADRSLLEVGDGAVLGHRSGYYCHILNPSKDGRLLLVVKKVRVGAHAFIGSGSRLGPGTVVGDRVKVDVLTDFYLQNKGRGGAEIPSNPAAGPPPSTGAAVPTEPMATTEELSPAVAP